MVGVIVSVVFVVLLWAVVIFFKLPLWIAIAVTLVVALGWGALFGWRRLKARAAAREIEQSLKKQADAHAETIRPDQQAEIEAMQAEFQKAVGALKSSKLARGGQNALAVLPWYMIIGPPGAGKSTALRASGLKFPYLSSRGGGVKGVGGTRNCEWWLTNEAVILDTAGRYTTEEEDREEWFNFLDTLARTRSRKPINGLIVGVSVADVGGETEEGVVELAKRLRERVDEVMARLQMVLPTYLLFTKCDLLPGFVETFGDLRKNERGQIWGFTVPLEAEQTERGELFRERFDELAACIEERSLERIGEERQQLARERIYGFPQQFEAVRSNLVTFVENLFAENVYQDTPIMRGVYFSSGTQEGRTIDRVMSAMAEAFGIRPAATAPEPVVEAKSYFIRDVFAKVIFPDRDVAVRSAKAQQRQVIQRYALAGGCLALALLVLFFPLRSFFLNRAFVRSTGDVVEGVAARLAAGEKDRDGSPLDRIEPLRARLAELVRYADEGAPFSMSFGMYQGGDLLPHVRRLYAASVRRLVLDPLFRQDVAELDAFARRLETTEAAPSVGDFARFYDRLKMHLLLTAPRALSEPKLGPADQAWLAQQVAERWTHRWSIAADPAAPQLIASNAELFAKLLAADPALALPRYEDVVRRVRRVLQRVPLSSLALEKLVAEADAKGYDLTLTAMLGGPVPSLKSSAKVRGAFTRRGFEEVLKDRLENAATVLEPWVLQSEGKEGDAAQGKEIQRLRSRYFEKYIEEWQTFLESIGVEQVSGNTQALATLQDLTRGEPPPFGRLFRAVAYNTRLGGLAGTLAKVGGGMVEKLRRSLGGAGQGAEATARSGLDREERELGPLDVDRTFAGFVQFGVPSDAPAAPAGSGAPPAARNQPLDVYQEQLAFIRDALQTAIESSDPGPLVARVQGARTRVRSLIDTQEIGWRPRLESLLWPPLEAASRSSAREAAAGASQKWCSAVALPFKRNMASRYPFRREGDDAAIADVAEFFRPNSGLVWGFYNEALRSEIQRSGDGFKFARTLGGVSGFRSDLLPFLKKAQDITTVLFPSGASDPAVQFSVRIRPTPRVAVVWFEVDGQKFDYRNGPEEWHKLVWPGQGKTLGASLRVRGVDGQEETVQQDGEWGLFRLLEAGRLKGAPGFRDFTMTWSLPGLGVVMTVDFRPARSDSPFFGVQRGGKARLLAPFRSGMVVPLGIGKGSPACN